MGHGRGVVRLLGLAALVLLAAAWIPSDAPVADAAMQGQGVDAVRALVEKGADVNAAQGDGMTALHWAAVNGDVELTRFLVSAGARLDATTRLGHYTPLHLAAREGKGAVIRALLDAGDVANRETATGEATPLHLAALSGTVEGVRALIEHGADVNRREAARGQTPLMFAAARGRLDVVKLLLAAGADPSLTSNVVDVPAAQLAYSKAGEIRNQVLAAFKKAEGGDDAWRPGPEEVQAAVKAAEAFQNSPDAGSDEKGKATVESPDFDKTWPRRVNKTGGLTPLLYAVREGHTDVALALLDGGAKIDQPSASDGTTPLLMAAINGRFDLAMELLGRGADPKITNRLGDSPLYATVETRWAPHVFHPAQHAWRLQQTTYLQLMEALLKAGADPNARLGANLWYSEFNRSDLGIDFWGATPFFKAAHALDVDAMKLLVAYGADPSIPTKNPDDWRKGGGNRAGFEKGQDASGLPQVERGGPGVYPIDAATGAGHGQAAAGNAHRHVTDGWLAAVKYLVEDLGADVNTPDYAGYTPLHNAASLGNNELVLYLVNHGANVMAVSRRGETTADMANSPFITVRPFPETIALLESLGSLNSHICLACGDPPRGK